MDVVNVLNVLKVLGDASEAGIPPLTVEGFQANPATGNFVNPHQINDGVILKLSESNVVDNYAEIDLGETFKAKQFRFWGHDVEVQNGEIKIQYYDGTWHDWKTGIVTRLGSWSDWSDIGEHEMSKIRIVNVITDSQNWTIVSEIEVKY